MLEFIYRFQQQRQGIVNMPKRLDILNRMLTFQCEINDNFYSIIAGDKRGIYLAVNKHQLDEFHQPIVMPCRGLDSAISNIYSLICKNHPELIKVNFELIEQKISRFPKKRHKLIREIYHELCALDPNFAIYGNIAPGKVFGKEYFALLEFNGVGVYDYLSYEADYPNMGMKLKNYLDFYFNWDYKNPSAILLLDLHEDYEINRGNIKFVLRKGYRGILQDFNTFVLGDYKITGDAIAKYKHGNNIYVLNPFCTKLGSSEVTIDCMNWSKQGWLEIKSIR